MLLYCIVLLVIYNCWTLTILEPYFQNKFAIVLFIYAFISNVKHIVKPENVSCNESPFVRESITLGQMDRFSKSVV